MKAPSLVFAVADRNNVNEELFNAIDFNFLADSPDARSDFHLLISSIASSLDPDIRDKNRDKIINSLFDHNHKWHGSWGEDEEGRTAAHEKTLETIALFGSSISGEKSKELLSRIKDGGFGSIPLITNAPHSTDLRDLHETFQFTGDMLGTMIYFARKGNINSDK